MRAVTRVNDEALALIALGDQLEQNRSLGLVFSDNVSVYTAAAQAK